MGRFSRSPLAIVLGALLIAAAAVALWAATHRPGAQTVAATPAAPPVKLERVRRGAFSESLVAQGRVGPPAGSDAKLAFALPGTLEALEVRLGQRVQEGQILASIDRRGLASALAIAQAEAAGATAAYSGGATSAAAVSSAQAKFEVARARLDALRHGGQGALSDRIGAVSVARQSALKVSEDQRALARERALFTGGVAAHKDVDAAQSQLAADLAEQRGADAKVAAAGAAYEATLRQEGADLAQADSDLTAARAARDGALPSRDAALARLSATNRDYENGLLRASGDGIVVAILKHAGESVDPATPVIDIAPLRNDDITLQVPGDDARRIRVGNAATLRIAGASGSTAARVIAVVPAVDPATQATTILVSGLPPNTVAGQAISASIVVGRAVGLLVPSSAVVTDPQSGKNVVFVHDARSKDEAFSAREVDIAADDGSRAFVRSGLRAGEEIAAQGAYDLLAPSGS